MKLNQLQAFVKIVELGSFSAAARELHVAQTAITQRISALEQELGVKVLVRSASGSEATPEGLTLYRHARGILRSAEIAKVDVVSPNNMDASVIVSLPSTLSFVLTAALLARVKLRAPGIRLSIVENASINAANIISAGEVDFGLLPNAQDVVDAETLTVYVESLNLVGTHQLLEGVGDSIHFRDLRRIPIVVPSRGSNLRRLIERAQLSSGARLDIAYEQNGFATIASIVVFGVACSILPRSMLSSALHAGALRAVAITNPSLEYSCACAWKSDRPLTKAATIVRSELIAAMTEAQQKGMLFGKLASEALDEFEK